MSVYDNNPQEVVDALTTGTNRKNYTSAAMPFNGGYPGLTRMTDSQAKEFVKKFKIIHQWSDFPDGDRPTQNGTAGGYIEFNGQQILANTGLSATLIQVRDAHGVLTNEYTLSIRSTEFRPFNKGGDAERDKTGADVSEIGLTGFAFAQLDALEHYYDWLKASGKLPSGTLPPGFKLNVTGYSLGGHLATVFTEIHQADMNGGQTVTFNGAGRGEIRGGTIRDMLADFRRFMASADSAGIPHDNQAAMDKYQAAKNAESAGAAFDPLSIYGDARYVWAVYAVTQKYKTAFFPEVWTADPNRTGTDADGLITQVWGKEIPNNASFTANSGIHGPALGVFIESQPLTEGWPSPLFGNGDFGNGHAIVLLADSLALMRVMQQLAPNATIEELTENLFPRSTNIASNTDVIGGPRSGNYEYDALENVLDGLRRIILGGQAAATGYTTGGSGFADLAKRQEFHDGLNALMTALGTNLIDPSTGITKGQASSLIGALKFETKPDASAARTDIGQFFCLYYQAPFTLQVTNPAAEAALIAAQGTVGSDWAHDKALSADDRAAGKAVFSDAYLTDRAEMLTFKLKYNGMNRSYTDVLETDFVDMENVPTYRLRFTDKSDASIAMRAEVIDASGTGNEASDKQIYFGSEGDDPSFSGGDQDDHLYGMGGSDTLNGQGGKDYIEGGNGADELHGGNDNDVLLGGTGADTLFGDSGQDKLDGGTGNDLLDGGADKDVLRGGDNNDVLLGGAQDDLLYGGADDDTLNGGTGNDWLEGGTGADTYQFKAGDGQDVIVDADADGKIQVEADAGDSWLTLTGGQGKPVSGQWKEVIGDHTYTYGFDPDNTGVGTLSIRRDDGSLSITVRDFQNGRLGITLADLPVPVVTPPANTGQAGSEYAYEAVSFDATAGRDVIVTKAGADTINGGADGDYIAITAGSKTVMGGDGNDFLETGLYVVPNAPLASLQNAADWQQGWANWQINNVGGEDDRRWTRALHDVATGQTTGQYDIGWHSGYDYTITSTDARGWIAAGAGSYTDGQTLQGGLGNDTIDASDGNDLISGDDGDDVLYGGAGDDTLSGGAGNDTLFGNRGDDVAYGGIDDDFIVGDDGNDSLYGGAGTDTILGDGVESGAANRNDFIDGGDGNDVIDAGGGNDTVLGGRGNDILFASPISDPDVLEFNLLDGGDGADTLVGSAGGDTLIGGAGNDEISGSGGAQATGADDDLIYGGDGDDLIVADGGNDVIEGGNGNDSLHGDNGLYAVALHGNDLMHGNAGNDALLGYGGNDTLFGDDGNDTVQGDAGEDLLDGGVGIDVLLGGDGNDALYGGDGDDGFSGTGGNLVANGGVLSGGAGNDSIHGGNGQDALAGDDGDDLLYGEAGDDQLEGGAGNDVLDGGAGINGLNGGSGNDTYVYSGGLDTIVDASGTDTLLLTGLSKEGIDLIQNGTQLQIVTGQGTGIVINNGFSGTIDRVNFGAASYFLDDLLSGTNNLTPQTLRAGLFQTQETTVGEGAPLPQDDPDQLDLRHFLQMGKNAFTLNGTVGTDTFYGGGANDSISGLDGDDMLYGAGGDDTINAGNGANYIEGEAGNDNLTGGYNYDTISGGDGNDVIWGGIGKDILAGDEGDDSVYGGDSDDTLSGGGGNDRLDGQNGNDSLMGGTGNDTLVAGNGDDTLLGGAGDDSLDGGYGADVYLFESGFGHDVITDSTAELIKNTVRFTSAVDKDTAQLLRSASDLIISFANNDQLLIKGYFVSSTDTRFDIQFADGSSWGINDIKPRLAYLTTAGDDNVTGDERDQLIDALGGNDSINGAEGNDTLVGGSGRDTLDGSIGNDLLQGGSDVDSLYGGQGDDTLDGGFGGVDVVDGGDGNDTYLVNVGSNIAINTAYEPGTNTIIFGPGIVPSAVSISRNGTSTLLTLSATINGTSTTASILNFFQTGNPLISEVRFADDANTVWTAQDLFAKVMTPSQGADDISLLNGDEQIDALAGDDSIQGLAGNDTIYGGSGKDTLDGGYGNDLLAGGSGSDTLIGVEGSDTYLFNLGDGHDHVQEFVPAIGVIGAYYPSRANDVDVVRLGAGINPTDVSIFRNGLDLGIVIGVGNDVITIEDYFNEPTPDSDRRIERIEFNNGNIWDRATIESKIVAAPVNSLFGSAGNDQFVVDNVNDSISEQANQGTDTVSSSVNWTLGNNLENLTLTGSLDLHGNGNSDANLILGNKGDNVLQPEADINAHDQKADTLKGGLGDDYYYVTDSNDQVVENAGEGFDTVEQRFSQDYVLPDNVEKYFSVYGAGKVTGNVLDNVFVVDSPYTAPLFLDGKAGADTYYVDRPSEVTYFIDNVGDKIVYSPGNFNQMGRAWNVNSTINYSLDAHLNNLQLIAGSVATTASGNSLNNQLRGNQNDNLLQGFDGNDSLLGYEGMDTLIGGKGDDEYFVGDWTYSVAKSPALTIDQWNEAPGVVDQVVENAGEGNDTLWYAPDTAAQASTINVALPDNVENLIFMSTSKHGVLSGSAANNLISSRINTSDTLLGFDGNDTLEGGDGWDSLEGGSGDDSLLGGGGRDYLLGGDGADTLIGGTGEDTLVGDAGANVFHVDGGKTIVDPRYSRYHSTGDIVDARGNLGSGISSVIFDTTDSTSVRFDWIGDDLVDQYTGVSILGYFNGTGFGNGLVNSIQFKDGVTWDPSAVLAHLLPGTPGNDTIIGTASADLLEGKGGNDTLSGLDGNDTLDGGTGIDSMLGGAGDDVYKADNTNDQVVELASNGRDEVQASANFTLSANIENLRLLSSSTGLNGQGNELANIIYGTDFVDTLDGAAGADTLYGGYGDDVYLYDPADTIQDQGGFDTVLSAVDATNTFDPTSSFYIEKWVLTGSNATTATGSSGNDVLDGSQNPNANTLIGGKGNDEYIVGSNDVMIELAGEGLDIVGVTADTTLSAGSNLEGLRAYGNVGLRLTGSTDVNVLYGNTGNDTLDGVSGADSMYGGAGSDTYYVDNTADVVSDSSTAYEDIDTVISSVTYTLAGWIDNLTLTGGNAINGTGNAEQNVLRGNSGVNVLKGGDGNDTYYVSTGDSVVENLDQGLDRVYSDVTFILGANVENLYLTGVNAINGTGNILNNWIEGNASDNILDGKAGDDWMAGGAGNDIYILDSEGDSVEEEEVILDFYDPETGETRFHSVDKGGIDTVKSSANVGSVDEDGTLWGLVKYVENIELTGTTAQLGFGNDIANSILGNSAANILRGFEGNDTLNGAGGADTMFGGIGDDTYVVDVAGDVVTENADEGTDLVQSSITYSLASLADIENLTLTGTSAINATGNAKDNILIGNSANNTLTGAAGNDRLDGGAGNDTMVGGTGNDTYIANTSTDVVTENLNEGIDTVEASATFSIASQANVENITLTGTSAINATGNAIANVLTGNSAANTLDGGAGIDTLIGGAGNDTYVVDNAGDLITENANEGTDLVNASATFSLATFANVENLSLTGTSAINATGNALDNVLVGNSGNNTLTGGAGNDRLDGGAGNDSMVGGAGNDTYVFNVATDVATENLNEGIDTIETGITLSLAAINNVENLTLTGTSAVNATGNALDNVLKGNSANNKLTGDAGNDRLDGGTGNDTMLGGTGNDTYVVNVSTDVVTENLNEGNDTVESSITYTIASLTNLENITLTGSTAINATGNGSANALIGNSGVNVLTGGAGNDTLDGAAGNDSLVGGTGNDTYVLGRGYGADSVTENDSTAGNTDVASFMSGISNDQIWFRKINTNDLEVSVIGTSDKLTLTSWYLGNQYHVEQFKTADGKLLLDSDVQKLVDAMAAFAPPAAGQTTLPSNYQTTLNPVLAANWH